MHSWTRVIYRDGGPDVFNESAGWACVHCHERRGDGPTPPADTCEGKPTGTHEQVYARELSAHIDALSAICRRNGIPFLCFLELQKDAESGEATGVIAQHLPIPGCSDRMQAASMIVTDGLWQAMTSILSGRIGTTYDAVVADTPDGTFPA